MTFSEGYFEVYFPSGDYFEDYFFQKIIVKLKIVSKIVFKQKINLEITFWANSHQNSPCRCVILEFLLCTVCICTFLIVANVLTYSLNFWRDISLWVGWVNQCLKCFTSSWFVTWPSFISMYCLTDSRENSVWKLAILKILSLLNCSTFFHSYGYVYYVLEYWIFC